MTVYITDALKHWKFESDVSGGEVCSTHSIRMEARVGDMVSAITDDSVAELVRKDLGLGVCANRTPRVATATDWLVLVLVVGEQVKYVTLFFGPDPDPMPTSFRYTKLAEGLAYRDDA